MTWKKLQKAGGSKFSRLNKHVHVIVRKGGHGFYITDTAHELIGNAKIVAIYNDGNGNFAFVPTDKEDEGYKVVSKNSLPTINAGLIVRDNNLSDDDKHRVFQARRENVNGVAALVFDSRNRPELIS